MNEYETQAVNEAMAMFRSWADYRRYAGLDADAEQFIASVLSDIALLPVTS